MKNTLRTRINHLLTKKSSLFLAIFCLFFIYLLFFYKSANLVTNFDRTFTQSRRSLPHKCSSLVSNQSFKTNIFFLKTHKTASSTLQNILMRFGLHRFSNFLLPKKFNYLGYLKPINKSDLDERIIPLDEKFNIFTHHSRYNRKTNEFLYPGTIKITILRNPAQLFESIFSYYNLQKFYHTTFPKFLSFLPHGIEHRPSKKQKIQGHNQMSRDLGLEIEYYDNETAIENFIRTIDAQFDFVMIQEYLEASLVLLANLLGWPLHYVSFIPLNVRNKTAKYNLTSADMVNLNQFNQADSKLYSHFLRKFRSCLTKYGRKRIIEDVQKLQNLNENLRRRCILEENRGSHSNIITYVLRDDLDWECVYSTKSELDFTEELRAAQISRIEPIKKLQKFINTG